MEPWWSADQQLQMRITLKNGIRIRVRIKVKSWTRIWICIKVMRIRNPGNNRYFIKKCRQKSRNFNKKKNYFFLFDVFSAKSFACEALADDGLPMALMRSEEQKMRLLQSDMWLDTPKRAGLFRSFFCQFISANMSSDFAKKSDTCNRGCCFQKSALLVSQDRRHLFATPCF